MTVLVHLTLFGAIVAFVLIARWILTWLLRRDEARERASAGNRTAAPPPAATEPVRRAG